MIQECVKFAQHHPRSRGGIVFPVQLRWQHMVTATLSPQNIFINPRHWSQSDDLRHTAASSLKLILTNTTLSLQWPHTVQNELFRYLECSQAHKTLHDLADSYHFSVRQRSRDLGNKFGEKWEVIKGSLRLWSPQEIVSSWMSICSSFMTQPIKVSESQSKVT